VIRGGTGSIGLAAARRGVVDRMDEVGEHAPLDCGKCPGFCCRMAGYVEVSRQDIRRLAKFLGRVPDTVNGEDLRRFQLHLAQIGLSPISINATVYGVRFFLENTLDRPELVRIGHPGESAPLRWIRPSEPAHADREDASRDERNEDSAPVHTPIVRGRTARPEGRALRTGDWCTDVQRSNRRPTDATDRTSE